MNELELDFVESNVLVFRKNRLEGVHLKVVDKGDVLRKIAKKYGINKDKIVAVCDSTNDLGLIKNAGFAIGFQPKKIIEDKVDVSLDVDDLRIILPFIDNFLQRRKILMIPGPSMIDNKILSKLSRQVIPHRSNEFRQLFKEITTLTKEVFNTRKDVIILTGSSTPGMESAIASIVDKDDTILVLSNGKFGERFIDISQRYGDVISYKREWGEDFNIEEIEEILKKNDIKAIAMVHNETSTGIL